MRKVLVIIFVLSFISCIGFAANSPVKSKMPIKITVINSLPWIRSGFIEMPSPFPGESTFVILKPSKGNTIFGKCIGDKLSFTAKSVPANGSFNYIISKIDTLCNSEVKGYNQTVENQFFRVSVDKTGFISSIYDKKRNKELVYPDNINGNISVSKFEGTNIIPQLLNDETEVVILDKGPVSAKITFDHYYKDSQFNIEIILYDSIPAVFVKIIADWNEDDSEAIKSTLDFCLKRSLEQPLLNNGDGIFSYRLDYKWFTFITLDSENEIEIQNEKDESFTASFDISKLLQTLNEKSPEELIAIYTSDYKLLDSDLNKIRKELISPMTGKIKSN